MEILKSHLFSLSVVGTRAIVIFFVVLFPLVKLRSRLLLVVLFLTSQQPPLLLIVALI